LIQLSIPSPSTGVIYLGPLPLRAYSLFIILGIFVAIWLGNKRWIAKGGKPGQVSDVAIFAVPFGIIGGRIYHVATDWEKYFGSGQNWIDALKIWNGGLGIWGAILFGGVGAWIGCKYYKIYLPPFADAIAPGIIFAQAIATFHPTFLYEIIWNVLIGFGLIYLDRKYKIGHGRLFALYVSLYSLGRLFIENLRIDEARLILGFRFNVFTSLVVIVGGLIYFVISNRSKPGIDKELFRRSA
jgi:prolipoprotein diacylglyceryltransferase